MATVRALVVHDEVGRIVSIARPADDAKVIIAGGEGQSVFETEVDDEAVFDLVAGSHRVDVERRALVANDDWSSA